MEDGGGGNIDFNRLSTLPVNEDGINNPGGDFVRRSVRARDSCLPNEHRWARGGQRSGLTASKLRGGPICNLELDLGRPGAQVQFNSCMVDAAGTRAVVLVVIWTRSGQ